MYVRLFDGQSLPRDRATLSYPLLVVADTILRDDQHCATVRVIPLYFTGTMGLEVYIGPACESPELGN